MKTLFVNVLKVLYVTMHVANYVRILVVRVQKEYVKDAGWINSLKIQLVSILLGHSFTGSRTNWPLALYFTKPISELKLNFISRLEKCGWVEDGLKLPRTTTDNVSIPKTGTVSSPFLEALQNRFKDQKNRTGQLETCSNDITSCEPQEGSVRRPRNTSTPIFRPMGQETIGPMSRRLDFPVLFVRTTGPISIFLSPKNVSPALGSVVTTSEAPRGCPGGKCFWFS